MKYLKYNISYNIYYVKHIILNHVIFIFLYYISKSKSALLAISRTISIQQKILPEFSESLLSKR